MGRGKKLASACLTNKQKNNISFPLRYGDKIPLFLEQTKVIALTLGLIP